MTVGNKTFEAKSRGLPQDQLDDNVAAFHFNGDLAHRFNQGLAPLTPKRKIRATSTNTTRSHNTQLFFRGQGRQPLGVGCVGWSTEKDERQCLSLMIS